MEAESWGLTRMVKVELVIGGEDAPTAIDIFTAAGATGFTAVGGVSGLGHGGFHQGRLAFNDRSGLSLLMVVVAPDRAPELVEGLRALLENRSGVLLVSETYVSRPEYFR